MLGALVALSARADDPKPDPASDAKALEAMAAMAAMAAKAAELEALAAKHVAEAADDALEGDLKTAASLFCQASDAKIRSRLVAVTGAILRGTKRESTDRAAIRALGAMGDPAGYASVQPFLVLPNPEESPPLMADAIAAASKMRSDESVPALLLLVQTSRIMPIAVAAMKAFSTFGRNEATRVKILVGLVETVKQDVPGIAWRWRSSSTPQPPGRKNRDRRYEALASPLVETLNTMTGQNIPDTDTWFDVTDKYKNHLAVLFPAK